MSLVDRSEKDAQSTQQHLAITCSICSICQLHICDNATGCHDSRLSRGLTYLGETDPNLDFLEGYNIDQYISGQAFLAQVACLSS